MILHPAVLVVCQGSALAVERCACFGSRLPMMLVPVAVVLGSSVVRHGILLAVIARSVAVEAGQLGTLQILGRHYRQMVLLSGIPIQLLENAADML